MQLPKWIQVYFGSLMTLQELGRFWGVKKLWKLKTMLAPGYINVGLLSIW